jgi:hypothetical protein
MRRVAVFACTTVIAACTGEIDPGDGDLGSSAIQIPTNGIVFFPAILDAFKNSPLASETFDPATGPAELASLPFDDETRKFIKYTVECALDPKQEVRFHSDVYTGLLGHCPSWHTNKPSVVCQEAVSGCLISRQNPADMHNRVSLRGELGEGGYVVTDTLALADTYAEDYLGTKIASFWDSCNGVVGEGRDCGWNAQTAFTGTCTFGDLVSVGAGASVSDCNVPLGDAISGDMVMRVCEGMSGCNSSGATYIASNDDTCGVNPAVDFACPPSEVFSVMLSPKRAGDAYSGEVGASAASTTVEFPTTILKLFTLLEASYYGNMFHKINPNVKLVSLGPNEGYVLQLARASKEHTGFGSKYVFPFEDAWCCHDPAIDPDYLVNDTGRSCSVQPVLDPNGVPAEAKLCVCESLGPCNTVAKNSKRNLCSIYDQSPFFGDVDHDECRDGHGVSRKHPTTVFLHGPCDMVGGEEGKQQCARK